MMKTGFKNICNTLSKIKLPPFLYYYMFAIWITQDYNVKCSTLHLTHSFFFFFPWSLFHSVIYYSVTCWGSQHPEQGFYDHFVFH